MIQQTYSRADYSKSFPQPFTVREKEDCFYVSLKYEDYPHCSCTDKSAVIQSSDNRYLVDYVTYRMVGTQETPDKDFNRYVMVNLRVDTFRCPVCKKILPCNTYTDYVAHNQHETRRAQSKLIFQGLQEGASAAIEDCCKDIAWSAHFVKPNDKNLRKKMLEWAADRERNRPLYYPRELGIYQYFSHGQTRYLLFDATEETIVDCVDNRDDAVHYMEQDTKACIETTKIMILPPDQELLQKIKRFYQPLKQQQAKMKEKYNQMRGKTPRGPSIKKQLEGIVPDEFLASLTAADLKEMRRMRTPTISRPPVIKSAEDEHLAGLSEANYVVAREYALAELTQSAYISVSQLLAGAGVTLEKGDKAALVKHFKPGETVYKNSYGSIYEKLVQRAPDIETLRTHAQEFALLYAATREGSDFKKLVQRWYRNTPKLQLPYAQCSKALHSLRVPLGNGVDYTRDYGALWDVHDAISMAKKKLGAAGYEMFRARLLWGPLLKENAPGYEEEKLRIKYTGKCYYRNPSRNDYGIPAENEMPADIREKILSGQLPIWPKHGVPIQKIKEYLQALAEPVPGNLSDEIDFWGARERVENCTAYDSEIHDRYQDAIDNQNGEKE